MTANPERFDGASVAHSQEYQNRVARERYRRMMRRSGLETDSAGNVLTTPRKPERHDHAGD